MRESRPGNASHLRVTTQQPEPGPLPLSINNVQNVAVLADGPSCRCGLVGSGILRPIELIFDFPPAERDPLRLARLSAPVREYQHKISWQSPDP